MRSRVRKLWAPIRRRIHIPVVIDRDADHRRTIFLAGTARSGTTWVSELINFGNVYRYIFEPFNPKKVKAVEPFGSRKYIRADALEPDLLRIATDVLTGRIRSRWTEQFNRRFIAHGRLIKEVRTNLLLKWLKVHFPELTIVLVLRHPLAVAQSCVRQGWQSWVQPLLDQPQLVQDHLQPHAHPIRCATTAFERAVCMWCVETLVPLRQFAPGEIHTVFYERFIADPEREITALYSYLGRAVDPALFRILDRPSFTAGKDSAISNGADPLSAWRGELSMHEITRALNVVRAFGLGDLYSEDLLPNDDAIAVMKHLYADGQRVAAARATDPPPERQARRRA